MRGYSSLLILEELLGIIARLESGNEEYDDKASPGKRLRVRCYRTLVLISGIRVFVEEVFLTLVRCMPVSVIATLRRYCQIAVTFSHIDLVFSSGPHTAAVENTRGIPVMTTRRTKMNSSSITTSTTLLGRALEGMSAYIITTNMVLADCVVCPQLCSQE